MSFYQRIFFQQKCEKCNHILTKKDFYIDTGYNDNCPHGNLQQVRCKYDCPKCMHYTLWHYWRANEEELCKLCVENKKIYQGKIKQKLRPEKDKSGLTFHVESLDCDGHWMYDSCCTAKCEDCDNEECSCGGIMHCCCNVNSDHEKSIDFLQL